MLSHKIILYYIAHKKCALYKVCITILNLCYETAFGYFSNGFQSETNADFSLEAYFTGCKIKL